MKCDICGGNVYYTPYDKGVCTECGQKYEYEEGMYPVLDDRQKEVLIKLAQERATIDF